MDKIKEAIEQLKQINDNIKNISDLPEYHKRISKFKIQYFEKDFSKLVKSLKKYQVANKESDLEEVLIIYYLILDEDIIKNLSFVFLDKSNSYKMIIKIFLRLKELTRFLDQKKKKNKIFLEIIKKKNVLINSEINILHHEESLFQNMKPENMIQKDHQILFFTQHHIVNSFSKLNLILGKQYSALMKGSPTKIGYNEITSIISGCRSLIKKISKRYTNAKSFEKEFELLEKKLLS